MFVELFPGLDLVNVMRPQSPQSAILSAVIFTARLIVALIPLARPGVEQTPSSASKLLSRNLYIYGCAARSRRSSASNWSTLPVQLIAGMS